MPSLNRASILIADDRISGRYRLFLEARAGDHEGDAVSVTLHDLSQTGLLFETAADLERDAEITLDIPAVGPVAARTVWTNGRFYGAEFDTPLSVDRVKAAIAESKVVWPHFAAPPPLDLEEVRAGRAIPVTDIAQQAPSGPAAPLREYDSYQTSAEPSEAEDAEPKFPLAVRVWIIAGLSLALWAAIFALFSLL